LNGGQAYSVHTGKMTMRITSVSSANSGVDIKDGNNLIYKLRVSGVLTSNTYIYDDLVTFIRDASGNFTLDFDNVPVSTSTLNSALTKGTKYIFALIRLTKSPNDSTITLESPALSIERTVFSSPGKINFCEAYSYNDDLTPVRSGSSAAIRILFGRLTANDMSGLTTALTGTGANAIRYLAFQNSQPVFLDPSGNKVSAGTSGATQLALSHFPESTDPYVFNVPMSSLGTESANYIRVQVWNSELGININAVESSPAFVEQALSYVLGPSNLTVTKTSETSITVTYTRQDTTRLNGNLSANVTNRVILVDDTTSTKVYETELAHAVLTPSVSYPNLGTGNLYRVYVIAETYYSRRDYNSISRDASGNPIRDASGNVIPDSTLKRFENVIIRDFASSVSSAAVEVTGVPTAPRELEVFASDKAITAYYDEPQFTHGVKSLRYHIYAYLSTIINPAAPVSIADVSGTSSITISSAVNSALAGAQATPIVNGTKYSVSMRAIGTVGGRNILNAPFLHQYTTGKVRNTAVINELSLVNTSVAIPSTDVSGLFSGITDVVPGTLVPTPSNVTVTSQSGNLVVSFKKETDNVTDLVITVNDSDATDLSGNPVKTFDTRVARITDGSGNVIMTGLFAVENKNVSANSLADYKFERIFNGEVPFYYVTFTGLKTAFTYNFSIRYCRNSAGTDTFSAEGVGSGSAESAPTQILSPIFSVDSQQIVTSWQIPSNTGRANAELSYTVSVTTESGSETKYDTPNTNFTISGLDNYANYIVKVAAYYLKNSEDTGSKVYGDYRVVNNLNSGKIKPRPAPVGATILRSSGDNSITYTIVPPTTTERTDYPITALNLYLQYSGNTSTRTLITSINQGAYTNATSSNLTGIITDFTAFKNSFFLHNKPINAFSYEFVIEYVANYSDAQNIPGSTGSVTPFGPVKVLSSTITGALINVVVNLNGSGAISTIVGLAKSNVNNNIVVQNLSAGTLPALNIFGSVDNTTQFVSAMQQCSFNLDYSGGLTGISDHLTAVVTPGSADTFVGSASQNPFFA
jgi:hypothetical protein